jgi:ribosomal-protein-alanine N-acetyltransferase
MRITTERLALREFTPADESAMHAIRRDPRFLEFYDPGLGTPEATARLHALFLEWQHEEPRTRWQLAVTLEGDDTPIGSAGIRRKPDHDFEADIGYELRVEHWGRGYATEAARALVTFGFTELGVARISAHCISENVRSAHVLEKLGMRLEGRLRANERFRDRWRDTSLYAILRDEWQPQRC